MLFHHDINPNFMQNICGQNWHYEISKYSTQSKISLSTIGGNTVNPSINYFLNFYFGILKLFPTQNFEVKRLI